jgi:hypothetical protein
MSLDLFWIYGILYHVKIMCEWSIVKVMCVCVCFLLSLIAINCDACVFDKKNTKMFFACCIRPIP